MASGYWKRRAERGMLYAQDQAEKRLVTIGKAMRDAQDYLTREAKSIFCTFANRFDLTEEQARAELARPITRTEYDRLVTRMATLPQGAERAALEVRANSGAYAYRISRAEALRENIAIETARVSQVVEDELTGQLRMTATEGYARRMYDLQSQTGNAFAVPDLDALRVATDTPWSGVSYSHRIWNDREKLAGALEETITSGYLSGKSHAKVARAIQERFGVSFREAERLVRTETSHISNQADLAAYRDAGIEQYEFDAALDSRTCPVCGRMDGQVFDVAKAETGENLPPMHPHCRCTTVMADKTKGLQRRGRDANGKSVLLPNDMTYEEWKQWQQAGAPADVQAWRTGKLDKYSQIHYNDNGTVVVTDNWTGKRVSLPKRYIANAVVDTGGLYNGKAHQLDRTFYDADGFISRQVHSGPHGNLKAHAYGTEGEHAHTYQFDKQTEHFVKTVRELTEIERKENRDIL